MKSKIQISLLLLFSLFFMNISSTIAQKSVELKYNLNEGDAYVFVTDMVQDITFEAMGQTTTLDQVMMFEMSSFVTKIEGDNISEDYVIERVKMDQKIFGMEIKFDSDDSSTFTGMGAQIAEQMNKVIGAQIKIVKDNRGNIIDVDLSGFTENSDLMNNLSSGNSHAVYPEGKVKVGDTWETDINPMEDSEMKVHMVYTLLKISRKHAELGVVGTISANEIEGKDITLDGNTAGTMIVDRKTGMLISSTIDLDMTMNLDQAGVLIPATIMGTTETKVRKVD